MTQPTSIRLRDDVAALWSRLAAHLGVSKAAVLQMALKELARKFGVK